MRKKVRFSFSNIIKRAGFAMMAVLVSLIAPSKAVFASETANSVSEVNPAYLTADKIDWDRYLEDPNYSVDASGTTGYYDIEEGEIVFPYDPEISIYEGDYDLLLAEHFLTVVASTPEAYVTCIPKGSSSKHYEPKTKGDTVPYWTGEYTCYEEENGLGGARGSYSSGLGMSAVEGGESYLSISWSVGYSFSVKIIANADETLDEFITNWIERSNSGMYEGWSTGETTLGGRRALERHHESKKTETSEYSYAKPLEPGEEIKLYGAESVTVDMTYLDEADYWEYDVIEPLNDINGFYAIIHIDVNESYSESKAAGGRITAEASSCRGQYVSMREGVDSVVPESIASIEINAYWDGNVPPPPITQTTTISATVKPGEDVGTVMDPGIVEGITIIGGAAVSIGLATTLIRRKKKKEEHPEEPEEELKSTIYKMYVKKDFGDTIEPGKPVMLYARIVEVQLPEWKEENRPDLSEYIRPFSPDGVLKVEDKGMEGVYHAALVSVPEGCRANVGTVTFQFATTAGSFTENVVFNLAIPQILFCQETIAFIAREMQESFMGLYVTGVGEDPVFTVNAKGETEKFFKLSEVKKAEDNCHKIEITEISDKKSRAGTMEYFDVEVTATESKPQPGKEPRSISGEFRILRFHEGIRFTMGDLKAYLVVKGTEGITTTEDPHIKEDKEMTPAHTRIDVTTFTWNEKEMWLTNPVPEEIEVFIEDVEMDEDAKKIEARNQEKVCEMLDFGYKPVAVSGSNNTVVIEVFQQSTNMLMPPARSIAKVTVQATYKGKQFKEETKVNVISLPRRDFGDNRNYAKIKKEDAEIEKDLAQMSATLLRLDTAYEMRPLINRIELIRDGYDEDFGYYMPEVYECKRLFFRFVNGEIGSRRKAEDISAWDYFWGKGMEDSMATVEGWMKSGPMIVVRLGVGIATGGSSEAVFIAAEATIKWTKAIKNYAETAENTDNLLKNFCVGASQAAWIGLKEYATYKATDYVVSKTMSASALVIKEDAKLLAKEAAEGAKKLKQVYNRLTYGTRLKRVDKLLGDMQKKASDWAKKEFSRGADIVSKNEKLLKNSKEYQAYRQKGKELVDKMAKSFKDPNISPEEQLKLVQAVQRHKGAMNHLNSKDVPDFVRMRFNQEQTILKTHTINQVKKDLEEAYPEVVKKVKQTYGKDAEAFKTFNATSNAPKSQVMGKSSSMDHDFTLTNRLTGEDVPSDVLKRRYARRYYENTHGGKSAMSDDVAMKYMDQADQTAVAKWDRESYADDIDQLMNKDLAGNPYKDINRAMDTTQFKTDEWVEKGLQWIEDAEKNGMPGTGAGQGFIHEGGRQAMKSNNRMVLNKVKAILKEGQMSADDLPMDKIQELMNKTELLKESFKYQNGKMGDLVALEAAMGGANGIMESTKYTTEVMKIIQDLQTMPKNSMPDQLAKVVQDIADSKGFMNQEQADILTMLISVHRSVNEKICTPEENKFYENQNLEGEKLSEWLSGGSRLKLPKVEIAYARGKSTKLPPQEKIEKVLEAETIVDDYLELTDYDDEGAVLELMQIFASERDQTLMEAMEESNAVHAAIEEALEEE